MEHHGTSASHLQPSRSIFLRQAEIGDLSCGTSWPWLRSRVVGPRRPLTSQTHCRAALADAQQLAKDAAVRSTQEHGATAAGAGRPAASRSATPARESASSSSSEDDDDDHGAGGQGRQGPLALAGQPRLFGGYGRSPQDATPRQAATAAPPPATVDAHEPQKNATSSPPSHSPQYPPAPSEPAAPVRHSAEVDVVEAGSAASRLRRESDNPSASAPAAHAGRHLPAPRASSGARPARARLESDHS